MQPAQIVGGEQLATRPFHLPEGRARSSSSQFGSRSAENLFGRRRQGGFRRESFTIERRVPKTVRYCGGRWPSALLSAHEIPAPLLQGPVPEHDGSRTDGPRRVVN